MVMLNERLGYDIKICVAFFCVSFIFLIANLSLPQVSYRDKRKTRVLLLYKTYSGINEMLPETHYAICVKYGRN